uniref:Uncharacterized protein n=1 Tax=Romanomermis culicivorax TaxID=13658 RepID=A0A915HZE8_ROMCU
AQFSLSTVQFKNLSKKVFSNNKKISCKINKSYIKVPKIIAKDISCQAVRHIESQDQLTE